MSIWSACLRVVVGNGERLGDRKMGMHSSSMLALGNGNNHGDGTKGISVSNDELCHFLEKNSHTVFFK